MRDKRLPWHRIPSTRSAEGWAEILRTTHLDLKLKFAPEPVRCDCGCGRDVPRVSVSVAGLADGLEAAEMAELLVCMELQVAKVHRNLLDALTGEQRRAVELVMHFLRSCDHELADGSHSVITTGETAKRMRDQDRQSRRNEEAP